jgi:hypothetical protein
MIELDDGFAVCPRAIAVLKRGDDGQTLLFTQGQSALEGFVVDREYDEVLEEVKQALEEDGSDEEEAEEEEEDET